MMTNLLINLKWIAVIFAFLFLLHLVARLVSSAVFMSYREIILNFNHSKKEKRDNEKN